MKNVFPILFFHLILFSCSKKSEPFLKQTNPDYDKAYTFDSLKISDSAYTYYDKAREIFKQNKDNYGLAKCLLAMAKIAEEKGNNYKSQSLSFQAIKYFDTNDKDQYYHISSNYNNLGITSQNLKRYNEAIKFYDSASKYAESEFDSLTFLKNKGVVYKEEKNYGRAIETYKGILPKVKNKDSEIYARLLSNLANVKWLNNPSHNAEPDLLNALEIERKINDIEGQNASYAHLFDYYKSKDPQKALNYAKMMSEAARLLKNPDDQLEALGKIILSNAENNSANFSKYLFLNDSIKTARDNDNDKFASVIYEVEENKAKYLTAKAEAEKRQIQQNIGYAASFLFLIGGVFWYRKRKKRLEQEKDLEVKNTELKYSKKVHDKVANKVYHVMSEVENTSNVDRNKLLDKLETIYHISRDISYEDKEVISVQNFSQQLYEMLISYSSDRTQVITIGNEKPLWEGVMHSSMIEVYYILQEFMTNMKKHSRADRVIIKFQREISQINISYSDNGVGIRSLTPKNGLKSTENRIKSLHGTIIFDTETEKGVKINLSFPAKN